MFIAHRSLNRVRVRWSSPISRPRPPVGPPRAPPFVLLKMISCRLWRFCRPRGGGGCDSGDGNRIPVVRGGGILNAKEARNGFTKNPKLCFLTSLSLRARGADAAAITERQVIGQGATHIQICRKRRRLGCVNSLPWPEGARRRDSRNLAFIFSCISVETFGFKLLWLRFDCVTQCFGWAWLWSEILVLMHRLGGRIDGRSCHRKCSLGSPRAHASKKARLILRQLANLLPPLTRAPSPARSRPRPLAAKSAFAGAIHIAYEVRARDRASSFLLPNY